MINETGESLFQAFLNAHDDDAWRGIVRTLLAKIHEVDRESTEIWFHFYPLALVRALEAAEDPAALARRLLLQGSYLLKDQIDSSHWFLYGHSFWPHVKAAICERAASTTAPNSLDLSAQICDVAASTAGRLKVDPSLLTGITAVGFMTLQQVGPEAFKASPVPQQGVTPPPPEQVLRRRKRDDSQGIFGFLRSDNKRFSVVFDERDRKARFPLINTQHLTTAAANDRRDYKSRDPRCVIGEGPIPVECRSASCGTCWVGIIAGREKLSEVRALESRRIKEFGYINTDESHPVIRLSCQAQAFGNVTIVIPPWNGVFGTYLAQQDTELPETLGSTDT